MITTYVTGRSIDLFSFEQSDIAIRDIAHSLSLINRFNGHTPYPMSVAQHSVFVSNLCGSHGPRVMLQGLLHDAAEAYIGDMTRFLKLSSIMASYRDIERRIEMAIMSYHNLPLDLTTAVKDADRLMVRFEARVVFGEDYKFYGKDGFPPLTPVERHRIGMWEPWDWEYAKETFMTVYKRLMLETAHCEVQT